MYAIRIYDVIYMQKCLRIPKKKTFSGVVTCPVGSVVLSLEVVPGHG